MGGILLVARVPETLTELPEIPSILVKLALVIRAFSESEP